MITDADVKKLSKVFATKDDLVDVIKPIKKSLKKIESKLDLTIRIFDSDFNYHHRRLDQIEKHINVAPPAHDVKVN
jgi:tetrahydromethanopterin S-methyltransferase subunit G